MSAPEPPPSTRSVWYSLLRRLVRRAGLPLLGLAALLVVAVLVVPPLLGPSAPPASDPIPPAAAPQAKPGMPPGPPAPRTPAGSELRVLLPNVATLDPGLAYDSESIPVIQLLFEGLLGVDANGRLEPRGAQRWQASPDGRTYTFHLDPDARWSDGQPVRAADYVFAWRRNVDPLTASPYAPALFAVQNGEAINRGQLQPDQLGVRAADDQTLMVTLEAPAPYFPMLAATWTYFPLREDLLQRYGDMWSDPDNLVSNGPYLLEGVREGPQVLLARNTHYLGPQPQVERITFRTYENLGQALTAFRDGNLDIMPYSARMDELIAGDPLLEQAVRSFPRSSTSFVVLNNRRPALQDPRVRRALGMALDRSMLLERVLGGAGEVATSMQPPGIPGRDPAFWPREDVAEARRLLAEAGYSGGQGLELVVAVPSVVDPIGRELQERWQDTLGVTLRLVEVGGFFGLRGSQEWRNQIDMYVGGWQSDYEDPYNWFNLLWESEHDPGHYDSGWRNPEFDRLVRAAQFELDASRRTELYREAERVMGADYPLIPLFHPAELYLVRPEVQGFQPGRTALTVPLLGVRTSGATPL